MRSDQILLFLVFVLFIIGMYATTVRGSKSQPPMPITNCDHLLQQSSGCLSNDLCNLFATQAVACYLSHMVKRD